MVVTKKAAFIPLVCTPSTRLGQAHEKLTCDVSVNHLVVTNAYSRMNLPEILKHLGETKDMELDMHVDFDANKLILPWQTRMLPACITRVLADMGQAHAMITGQGRVKGRVRLVFGTPCPNWHVDKVDVRGLCTLYGPGSVIRLNNEQQIQQKQETVELSTGDVVFMKGTGQNENLENAVIHRSPIIDDDLIHMPRLIIQTDSFN